MTPIDLDALAVILEEGPAPCSGLARAIHRRTADVDAALRANPKRFEHLGTSRRNSRWALKSAVGRMETPSESEPEVELPPGAYTLAEFAAHWRVDVDLAQLFLDEDEGFVERGVVERVNGGYCVTELGYRISAELSIWGQADPLEDAA